MGFHSFEMSTLQDRTLIYGEVAAIANVIARVNGSPYIPLSAFVSEE
jgi:hypothetical protein